MSKLLSLSNLDNPYHKYDARLSGALARSNLDLLLNLLAIDDASREKQDRGT